MGDYFILAALVTKEKMVKELACEVSEIFMILKYYIKNVGYIVERGKELCLWWNPKKQCKQPRHILAYLEFVCALSLSFQNIIFI